MADLIHLIDAVGIYYFKSLRSPVEGLLLTEQKLGEFEVNCLPSAGLGTKESTGPGYFFCKSNHYIIQMCKVSVRDSCYVYILIVKSIYLASAMVICHIVLS